MPKTLAIQLFISFLVGGGFVTLLSFLAEKAKENIAGIIMMFPSTVVVGLFFLGVTTSAEQVAGIVPAILIPLGIVILSSVIYSYFARVFKRLTISKLYQVGLTFVCTSIVWFLLAAPFAVWKTDKLLVGLCGYLLLIGLAQVVLNRNTDRQAPARIVYSRLQILFRAVFIGTVIACVVFLGKVLNPFWGGIFVMYPAATLAALMIFHWYYEPEQLLYFFKKAPLGSLSICVYCLSVMFLFPKFGVGLGTGLSLTICMVFSLTLIKLQKIRYGN